MKRMHIHISVNELSESIHFYSSIFGAAPTIEREDYAKWKLDQPSVNFAISHRGHASGVNHLGIQVESEEELQEIAQRLNDAEIESSEQKKASCCYAHSDKHWTLDPQGIAWESFHSLGESSEFGCDTMSTSDKQVSACCIPLHLNESDRGSNKESNADSTENAAACCAPNDNTGAGCC